MSKERWVHGFHAVTALLRHNAASIIRIYYDGTRQDPRMRRFLQQATAVAVPLTKADSARLDAMTHHARHQGIAAQAVAEAPQEFCSWLKETLTVEAAPILMVLDGITDPHNLGACFRAADAASVAGIVVPKDRSVGLTPAVRKVASGAVETVPFFAVANLSRTLEYMKNAGLWIFGADADAEQRLPDVDLTGPTAWVFGAEGPGMRRLTRQHCDYLVSIPMYGHVESLNIAVSAGICLYETRRQRLLRPSSS